MKPLTAEERKGFKSLFKTYTPAQLGLTERQFFDIERILQHYSPEDIMKTLQDINKSNRKRMIVSNDQHVENGSNRSSSRILSKKYRRGLKSYRGSIHFKEEPPLVEKSNLLSEKKHHRLPSSMSPEKINGIKIAMKELKTHLDTFLNTLNCIEGNVSPLRLSYDATFGELKKISPGTVVQLV